MRPGFGLNWELPKVARALAVARRTVEQWLRPHGTKVRFLMAGAVNTAFGLGIFPILMWILTPHRVHYLVVLIISQCLSITIAFINNKYFVFRTTGNHVGEYGRFVLFYLSYFGVNLLILPIMVEHFHLNPIIAQTLFSISVILLSYIWHRNVTFRPKKARSQSE
jgi:putative flippase GtrA